MCQPHNTRWSPLISYTITHTRVPLSSHLRELFCGRMDWMGRLLKVLWWRKAEAKQGCDKSRHWRRKSLPWARRVKEMQRNTLPTKRSSLNLSPLHLPLTHLYLFSGLHSRPVEQLEYMWKNPKGLWRWPSKKKQKNCNPKKRGRNSLSCAQPNKEMYSSLPKTERSHKNTHCCFQRRRNTSEISKS